MTGRNTAIGNSPSSLSWKQPRAVSMRLGINHAQDPRSRAAHSDKDEDLAPLRADSLLPSGL